MSSSKKVIVSRNLGAQSVVTQKTCKYSERNNTYNINSNLYIKL